jgi:hypothetical protein
LITRRRFIQEGIIGTVGAITRKIHTVNVSDQQSESKQQAEAAGVKSPIPRILDDEDGRGADFVILQWDVVTDARTYDLRFDWNGGSKSFSSAEASLKCIGLRPNRSYRVYLRVNFETSISGWSQPLETCTRPPRPISLEKGYDGMTDTSGITLLWNVNALVAGIDDEDNISVAVGVERSDGTVAPLSKGGKRSGRYVTSRNYGLYHIRLETPNSSAPSGTNCSQWSEALAATKMVFAALEVPGISQVRRATVVRMGNYYA